MIKNKKNRGRKSIMLFIFFILGGFLVELFTFFLKRKKRKIEDVRNNFNEFIKKERKEVEELATGKESFKEYCGDSSCLFMDYFIPYDGNDNKPKILRAKPLLIIIVFSILLKVGIMGYFLSIYPNMAKMQQEIVSEILALTNQDRQDNNLPSLEINPVLSSSAVAKANDMVANNYFSHYGPDGKKPWDWINREEYAYLNVGENLAMNFSSASSAHLALMQSPLHKKNILNSNYKEIGLAVARGEIDGKNTTVLVELFGSRKKTEEPKEITQEDDKVAIALVEIEEEAEVKVLAFEKTDQEEKDVIEEDIIPAEENIIPEEENITPIKEEIIVVKEEIIEEVLEDEKMNISGEKIIETEDRVISENEEDDLKIQEKIEDNQEDFIAQIEEKNDLNKEVLAIVQKNNKKINIGIALVTFSKYAYILMLVGVISFLLINIFVRIRIQHKPVIIQSLLVIVVLFGLLFYDSNLINGLVENIFII